MIIRPILVAIAASLVLNGCAVVPPESVKLSSAVGQNLSEIKKSHIYYINSYYERLETQANQAVDLIFAPSVIAKALNGDSGKQLFQRLEAGKKGGADANEAIAFAARFLMNVRKTVEARRQADIKPIKDARAAALAQVEAAYTQTMQGNATVTAYLASVAKVRETQDQMFASVGLPDIQDKTADTLSGASDDIADLVQRANDRDAKLDELQKLLEHALKRSSSK